MHLSHPQPPLLPFFSHGGIRFVSGSGLGALFGSRWDNLGAIFIQSLRAFFTERGLNLAGCTKPALASLLTAPLLPPCRRTA